jgi:hypothetical protein
VTATEAISKSRGPNPVDCFEHPDMFAERAIQRSNGELLVFQPVPDPDALAKAGANVINTREPQVIGVARSISAARSRVSLGMHPQGEGERAGE